jgi:hypothetical protein
VSPTIKEKAEAFWALHAGEPFVIPNPSDAGSARVAEGAHRDRTADEEVDERAAKYCDGSGQMRRTSPATPCPPGRRTVGQPLRASGVRPLAIRCCDSCSSPGSWSSAACSWCVPQPSLRRRVSSRRRPVPGACDGIHTNASSARFRECSNPKRGLAGPAGAFRRPRAGCVRDDLVCSLANSRWR